MKTLTRKQLESRKAQAVRFARDVLGDEDRAEEIEDESLEDYANRRHIQIQNPKGAKRMAVQTRRELLERIEELEQENEELQGQLEEIRDIIGDDEEEEEEEEPGEE